MSTITESKLIELRACKEGVSWFAAQKETEIEPLCAALIEAKRADWANWLLTRLMTTQQRVKYAIFAAEQVLHIFEAKYPDDSRPRHAIEGAKAHFDNTREKTYAAAYAAADAAAAAAAADDAAAADAAAAAAAAAYAAAAAAAAAAAYAAADAAAAAAAAAYAAADARKEMQTRIVDYGIKLLRAGE